MVQSTMTDWEVTVEFSVTGRPMLGGDGFAFWYVDRPGLLGPVYGSSDYWNGLLIAFDTFNNDGQGRNPLITAHNVCSLFRCFVVSLFRRFVVCRFVLT